MRTKVVFFIIALIAPLFVLSAQTTNESPDSISVSLDEIVVTAEMVNRFSDHRDYLLSKSEKEQFPTAIGVIQTLPKIKVDDMTVSSVDGKGVKILINGVPSSAVDLASIPSENISKIQYYSQPPIQYSNMGLGAVINILTKKRTGGSLMLNTLNAVTTGFGNDVVSLKYNWGNSTIGLTYNINYRNYNNRRLDETIRYDLNESLYLKTRTGRKSPYAYEQQSGELSYSNAKAEDYVFNAKLSFGSLNRRRSSVQDIIMNFENGMLSGVASSNDKDQYLNPAVDLYFNKQFGKRHELTLNAVGTYYNSSYDYAYSEEGIDDPFNTKTNIETDKYSIIGEGWYGYALTGMTKFLIGARYAYNTASQKHSNNSTTTNEFYAYTGLTGMLNQEWSYTVSAGLNGNYFTDLNGKDHSYYYFRPQLNVSYFIDQSSDLTLNYEANTLNPTISQLTFNPYYRDIDYMYAGNPGLKPQNIHQISLTYFKGFKNFILNPEISYTYSKNYIAPIFILSDEHILETIANLDRCQNYKASLFLQWMPLPKNLLRIRLYSEVMHTVNKYEGNSWHHTGYTIAPSIYLNYKKWSAEIFYQTETEMLSGHILLTRPSMAKIEVSYRPIPTMTVGLGIRYPFYDSWKETKKTFGTDNISTSSAERIINNANMVYVNFVYNLPFGKPSKAPKQKTTNTDKDSGIFNRL